MMKMPRTLPACFLAVLLALGAAPAMAFDPPPGGDSLQSLFSPVFLSGFQSVASSEAPMADTLNPAASGNLQRPTLDFSYAALTALGAEPGLGTVLNLGIALPQPYGVWTGYLGLVSSPFGQLPLGSVVRARVGMAKDLYPKLLIGAGIDFSVGSNDGLGWGLDADLGMQGLVGDLGFMRDFRWGFAFRNLGMPFKSPGTVGISGAASGESYDSPFTPAMGVSADLVRLEKQGLSLAASADLSFPTFQNLIVGFGLQADWRDKAYLRLGWDLNLRESLAGTAQSLLPSFGIGANFAIDRSEAAVGSDSKPWDKSELRPSIAAQKLYGDIWAIGLGVNMPLGVVDKTPPLITVKYPETPYDAYYFSPNNDGTRDELTLPISIIDQRYVQSFELKVFDKDGVLVRSIANKESRPETEDLAGFFKRLSYVKKGVPVPPELAWNGLADSGELAADGAYTLVIEASDDNGNRAATQPWPLVVDNSAPTLKLARPTGADGSIFSPDGDGNKDSFAIAQESSIEDLWKASIVDAGGAALRAWDFKANALTALSWDGKNNDGQVVPDGVYQYQVSATDRAGNKGSAQVDNIIVNTQQPPVSIAIDQAAFSPNGDGVQDVLSLSPNVPVRAGLSSWSLSVVDSSGAERWARSGSDSASLVARYPFDGKDAAGKALAEGEYRTRLIVGYVNGHRPTVWSPAFVIDLSPPSGTVSVDREAFNPLGDVRAKLLVRQSGSTEDRWLGQILNAQDKAVKSWTFIGQPDAELSWDGSDDAGRTVDDGVYRYRLSAADRAGNSLSLQSAVVKVDTEKKAVRVSLDKRSFSPNGDGVNDTLALLPELQSSSQLRDWTLSLSNAAGQVQRRFTGKASLPARVAWDGKTDAGSLAPDGNYLAVLEVRFATDEVESARSVDINLDTKAPAIQASAADLLFSPNGDKRKDSIVIKQSSEPGDSWTGSISNAAGKVVREWTWKDSAADLEWDGTDAQGNVVADGAYRYGVRSEDAAGNKAERVISGITVDTRSVQAFVTADSSGFSPNGDGVSDTLGLSVIVNLRDGVDSWRLALVDAGGVARRVYGGKGAASIPTAVNWDGKGDNGSIVQGEYSAQLSVDYLKGDRAEAKSASFVLDSEGPRVGLSLSPEFFSPDNDGVDDELRISLSVADASLVDSWRFEVFELAVQEGAGARRERLFFSWSGRGRPAERLAWDGRSQRGELVESATDYPYRFTITDAWGNKTVSEGVIKVDVLVVRDGDRLKIKVPSIVFRANFADFKELTPEVLARNEEVLRRIAAILNRFKEYKIRVEGHANSIAKMTSASQTAIDREENGELLPLSLSRAQAVMGKLIEFGVDAKRLSARGLGSSEPVVLFTDAENRWKNRRVEFILIKE